MQIIINPGPLSQNMKIGFLISGIMISGLQIMLFISQMNLIWFMLVSPACFFIVGSVFIIEGLSSDPGVGIIEEQITKIKEEILDLKYPLESNNGD